MNYEDYLNEIDLKADKICKVSDKIWECAELAFSEHKSAQYIMDALKEEGFNVKYPVYNVPTAFTGSYGSGKPVIGILGEFDALANLNQEADLPEKKAAIPGANGHGCGHNMLGTGALAAVIGIKEYLEKSGKPGTVIYYGCPGEEGGSGKAFMAREGAFDNLDFAITWHPSELNMVCKDSSLANIQVLYKFYGVSSHAAGCPELGRSALDAVELMNIGSNFLREHMVQEARIHYAIINSGGISPNVVQNYSEVLYLIRAPKSSMVQELFERVNKIAEGMAMATETKMEYEIIKLCSNIVPNNVIEKVLYKNLKDIPLPEYSEEELEYVRKFTESSETGSKTAFNHQISALLMDENKKFMQSKQDSTIFNFIVPYEDMHIAKCSAGSTDVGDVSFKCPTSQINCCTWAPDSGGHSWQIVAQGKSSVAHKGLLYAGKVIAAAAIDMLENPDLIEDAKKEYMLRMKSEKYIPIPFEVMPRPIDKLA